jgi:hypothetical protein
MAHVHAALIQQFAKDAMEYDEPGWLWEYSTDGGENWESFCDDHNPLFNPKHLYRRIQETIDINGHKVPKPLRVDEIEKNVYYYMPYFLNDLNKYMRINTYYDLSYYAKKGLLHKTEEAAIAHAEALMSFTEQ